MVYSQQIQFNSSAVVTLRWLDFKQLVNNKMLPVQYITNVDGYTIFSFDQDVAYKTFLFFTTVSPNQSYESDYSQAQNDSDSADFLANFYQLANMPIAPRTTDGRIRIAAEKTNQTKNTVYTPNYCDPTTWYPASTYVPSESASINGTDGYYHLANQNIIDSFHGKISDEDNLIDPDGYSYRVIIIQDGYTMTEQDPHYATGGDYVINYDDGYIIPITLTQPITASYHYESGSTFILQPAPGKAIAIDSAECEFSTDIIITDTVLFTVMGYASVFAPQLGLPSGYRIPISITKYKTMNDYYNDAVKSYPTYPPMGGNGWRGISVPSTVLNWDYVATTAISYTYGMQVVISLQHNEPFGGAYATTTFFTIVEPDPNA